MFIALCQANVPAKSGASKAPVRSASMGPQPSNGTGAAGGTRQGRWALKNQVRYHHNSAQFVSCAVRFEFIAADLAIAFEAELCRSLFFLYLVLAWHEPFRRHNAQLPPTAPAPDNLFRLLNTSVSIVLRGRCRLHD